MSGYIIEISPTGMFVNNGVIIDQPKELNQTELYTDIITRFTCESSFLFELFFVGLQLDHSRINALVQLRQQREIIPWVVYPARLLTLT